MSWTAPWAGIASAWDMKQNIVASSSMPPPIPMMPESIAVRKAAMGRMAKMSISKDLIT